MMPFGYGIEKVAQDMAADPSPKGSTLVRFNCVRISEATDPFNTVQGQPMERLDEEEEAKHEHEWYVEVIAKDGECKERLCYEEPKAIMEALYFLEVTNSFAKE